MLIFTENEALTTHLSSFKATKKSIGFVPTMGALHQGHLSLIDKSLQENDITVMSIFVNPTQFNNQEDLAKYPRTLENDVEKIKALNTSVIIFAPTVSDIYKENVVSQKFEYDNLEHQMEGKHREGHFNGVGTIIKRLFEIIKPSNAYFGEKDFQQLQIVKKLVSKYVIPVNIIGCSIYREENGLAMSSRNERLSKQSREKAAIIFATLNEAKELFKVKSAKEVTEIVVNKFKKTSDFKLEYFEIADESNLLTCKRKDKNKSYRAFIAVFIEDIRLIDNISMQ